FVAALRTDLEMIVKGLPEEDYYLPFQKFWGRYLVLEYYSFGDSPATAEGLTELRERLSIFIRERRWTSPQRSADQVWVINLRNGLVKVRVTDQLGSSRHIPYYTTSDIESHVKRALENERRKAKKPGVEKIVLPAIPEIPHSSKPDADPEFD